MKSKYEYAQEETIMKMFNENAKERNEKMRIFNSFKRSRFTRFAALSIASILSLTACGDSKNVDVKSNNNVGGATSDVKMEDVPSVIATDGTSAGTSIAKTDAEVKTAEADSPEDLEARDADGEVFATTAAGMFSEGADEYGGDAGLYDMKAESGMVFDAAYAGEESFAVTMPEAVTGEMPSESETNYISPSAGLLTAGEWSDNLNFDFFTNLVNNNTFEFGVFNMTPYSRVEVKAVSDQQAVKNAKVVLSDASGNVIYSAVTDNEGRAYLFYNAFSDTTKTYDANGNVVKNEADVSIKDGDALTVTITSADGKSASESITAGARVSNTKVDFDSSDLKANTDSVKNLDVMFVFDTTGSMSDELTYLQAEFDDIATRISKSEQNFDIINYSMNFYRDEGDEYVVKSNPFTTDVNEALKELKGEIASGGGDYPEAVDQAIKDAVLNHSWNEDSTKIMFLILDAPAHSYYDEYDYYDDIKYDDITLDGIDYDGIYYEDTPTGDYIEVTTAPGEVLEETTIAVDELEKGTLTEDEIVGYKDSDYYNRNSEFEGKKEAVKKNIEEAVKAAAENGIRIIPIASSGVDQETEAMCRDFSLLTGGTYTFLTDHSGIGGSHAEPTIGDYDVKHLNDLIVEIVNRYTK